MPQNIDKTKKRAAIFGGRPFLETSMLFQDGQVTSRTSWLTGLAVPFGSAPNWNICVTHFNPNLPCKKLQAF
jgi:hypothetical protein